MLLKPEIKVVERAQHAVAGDLAFALRAAAKRLNRHVMPLKKDQRRVG